jgi:hypothetical protein
MARAPLRRATACLLVAAAVGCKGKADVVAATPAATTSPSAPASSSATKQKKPTEPTPIARDEGPDATPSISVAPGAKRPFAVRRFDEIPEPVKYEGKIEGGLSWTDAYGDNLALFTRRESSAGGAKSVYLRAYHWANGGQWRLIREVKDQSEKCAFDTVTAFVASSFKVEDADENGVGEVRFAYTVDCTSDVSPSTAKVLVLEGGAKFILRGKTRIFDGNESYGGTYVPDPAAALWKPTLRAGAESEWNKQFMGPKP